MSERACGRIRSHTCTIPRFQLYSNGRAVLLCIVVVVVPFTKPTVSFVSLFFYVHTFSVFAFPSNLIEVNSSERSQRFSSSVHFVLDSIRLRLDILWMCAVSFSFLLFECVQSILDAVFPSVLLIYRYKVSDILRIVDLNLVNRWDDICSLFNCWTID